MEVMPGDHISVLLPWRWQHFVSVMAGVQEGAQGGSKKGVLFWGPNSHWPGKIVSAGTSICFSFA